MSIVNPSNIQLPDNLNRLKIPMPDQREAQRVPSGVPLRIAAFTARYHRNYAARAINHGQDGMCLETSELFRPGSAVFIRQDNSHPEQKPRDRLNHLRTSTLARVIWCRPTGNDRGRRYHIGVEYY